jgi:hypothetical protein
MASKCGPVQKSRTAAKRGNSAKGKKKIFGKWQKPAKVFREVKQ